MSYVTQHNMLCAHYIYINICYSFEENEANQTNCGEYALTFRVVPKQYKKFKVKIKCETGNQPIVRLCKKNFDIE